MMCSRQFTVSKKFMEKRGGGREPRFPVEYFLSHSAKKFLNGTLVCFTEFPLSKIVRDKGGCDSRFSVENFFVSQSRKNSQGNPSVMCFRKTPVAEKPKENWREGK